jgi:hypothetical protein
MSTAARIAAWAAANGIDPATVTATCDGERVVEINGSRVYAAEAMAIPQATVDAAQSAVDVSKRLASFAPLVPHAVLFRATLRKHFGANAETNREVTAGTVADYFTARQIAGTISAAELADAVVLDKLFTELAAWGGTGETWSLPWEQVPG